MLKKYEELTNFSLEAILPKVLVAGKNAGYLSGEHITGFEEGRPLFVRTPESKFNLSNFMRTNLYASLGALKMGMALLALFMLEEEKRLNDFLDKRIFVNAQMLTISPKEGEVKGFEVFMTRYKNGLKIEKTAVDCLK